MRLRLLTLTRAYLGRPTTARSCAYSIISTLALPVAISHLWKRRHPSFISSRRAKVERGVSTCPGTFLTAGNSRFYSRYMLQPQLLTLASGGTVGLHLLTLESACCTTGLTKRVAVAAAAMPDVQSSKTILVVSVQCSVWICHNNVEILGFCAEQRL